MDDHHQRERRAARREVGRRNWTACDQDSQRQSLDLCEVDLDLEDKISRTKPRVCSPRWWPGARPGTSSGRRTAPGLDMPQAVANATREIEEANNHVVEFIHACVNFGEGYAVPLAGVNKE